MKRKDFLPMRGPVQHGFFAAIVICPSLFASAWALGGDLEESQESQMETPPAAQRMCVHGGLFGTVPQWSGVEESLRSQNDSVQFRSPKERKWRLSLAGESHGEARPSHGWSISAIFQDWVGLQADRAKGEGSFFLDEPGYGFSSDMKRIREALEREGTKRARQAAESARSEFQEELAKLTQAQNSAEFVAVDSRQAYGDLVPINVPYGPDNGGTVPDAGMVTIAGGSLVVSSSGAATVSGVAFSPQWYGLPTVSAAPVGGWSGASVNVTPSVVASLPPTWNRESFVPVQASAGTIHLVGKQGSGTVVSTVAQPSSLTITANLSSSPIVVASTVTPATASSPNPSAGAVVVSGATFTTSSAAVVTSAVSAPTLRTTFAAVSQPVTLFIVNAASAIAPHNGFVGAYSGTTGAAVSGFTSPPAFIEPYGIAVGSAPSSPNIYVSDESSGNVYALNPSTGALISGFTTISLGANALLGAVAVTQNFLWVAAYNSDSNAFIRQYNATTGAYNSIQINLTGAYLMTILGNTLYAMSADGGQMKAYNATTGAAISASFLPSSSTPNYLASSGQYLYLSTYSPNQIHAYDPTTGLALAGFTTITLPGSPGGMAIYNNDLWVADDDNNTIYEYNALTGASIGYTSPTGLDTPEGIAVIPEPGSVALLGLGALMTFGRRRKERGHRV